MGGSGSGRSSYFNSKSLTDDFHSLDIRWLHRAGLLARKTEYPVYWYQGDRLTCSITVQPQRDGLLLKYSQRISDGSWEPISYQAPITWTNCHYGGRRPWFACPADSCSRRVAILFGGSIFACRHCHRLAYKCQREAEDLRLIRRTDKIREKLGWERGLLRVGAGKPKHMHWTTYLALLDAHDTSFRAAMASMRDFLGSD